MNFSEQVLNITDEQFNAIIEQNSVVLVDFWAPWCGPCMKLLPVIDQLAVFYKGQAKVAKLNISDNSVVPSTYNIKNIPTVLIFYKGKPVHRFVGCVSIDEIKSVVDPYVN